MVCKLRECQQISTGPQYLALWTRFHPIIIFSIISVIIRMITMCMGVCVCFNSLSDNESRPNTIRVIWYFVMLYNCLVSFQP